MGAVKELIGVPAPFQLAAKPRLCRICGEAKMIGRAPNATNCLDCAGGKRRGPRERRYTGMRQPRLPVAS